MTNHLLDHPRAVLIHIPKTAGTSIRSLWPEQSPRRLAFGHIPADWQDAFRFAVVRNPRDRFLSAVRMFRFGNADFDGSYRTPTLPDLTVSQALDIVEDDTIPFDRAQRFPKAGFRHHAIAQTHPFNCLHMAQTVLRQETLDQDWPAVAARLGLPVAVPRLRTTTHAPALEVTTADEARIARVFAADFAALGYDPAGAITGPVTLPATPATPGVWPLWPAFFSNDSFTARRAGAALPAPDADLTPFAADIVTGQQGGTWPAREKDLNAHFHSLLPEFVGQPRIAHLMACTIVVIRRTDGAAPALDLFFRMLSEFSAETCGALNTRWLTSVADTLADHGRTPTQRALGMAGTLLANTVKLAESERRMFHAKTPWPPKHRFNAGGPLFDGTIAFWTEKGDMIANMLDRLEKIQDTDAAAAPVLLELMMRLMAHDTVYRRFARIAGQEAPPILPDDAQRRFRALVREWL